MAQNEGLPPYPLKGSVGDEMINTESRVYRLPYPLEGSVRTKWYIQSRGFTGWLTPPKGASGRNDLYRVDSLTAALPPRRERRGEMIYTESRVWPLPYTLEGSVSTKWYIQSRGFTGWLTPLKGASGGNDLYRVDSLTAVYPLEGSAEAKWYIQSRGFDGCLTPSKGASGRNYIYRVPNSSTWVQWWESACRCCT